MTVDNAETADTAITQTLPDITESACQKIADLIHEADNLSLKLRVYVEGGGCSGFQYGFEFIETAEDDDFLIEKTVKNEKTGENLILFIVIDPLSLQYLAQATIDYKTDLNGERFIIHNPNAKTTCGCGSSFSMPDEED